MNIGDTIGSGAVQQIATQFGLTPQQAQLAVGALLPMVAAGLQKETASRGEAGLAAALSQGNHEAYLQNPASLGAPATALDGNSILGHIFGSKETSREVAANASQKTGIDPAILKKMLPIVAALAMGALARKSKQAGGGAQPGAGAPLGAGAAAGGGLAGMLGSLLDRDKDGSMLDDLGGMLGGSLGGRPR